MKFKQTVIWLAALVIGAVLGTLGIAWLDEFLNFVASAYTRLFQFVAVPTVALAILTALASLGEGRAMGKVFAKTLSFTVLTSFVAAVIGLVLFLVVNPGEIDESVVKAVADNAEAMAQIKTKEYAGKYALSGKRITLVGISFSSEKRTIVEELVEEFHV